MDRLQQWWADFRDSLWFLPAVLTAAASVLAVAMLALDRAAASAGRVYAPWPLFGGGAEGARGMLAAIAGGVITVTGVIFSVTIVALQLASTQFTPRVLRNFTSDRANQLTLGTLIATFTFTLLVLRSIRGGDAGPAFVPSISISVALLLTLASIGFLIFFIGHLARSLQAVTIVDRVTKDTIEHIRKHFADGADADEAPGHAMVAHGVAGRLAGASDGARAFASRGGHGRATVSARVAGYVLSVDVDELLDFARARRAAVRVEVDPGEFVLPGRIIASVRPATRIGERDGDRIRAAIRLGRERTVHQDPGWGLVELADIGVRALSPGVNDPTTASMCVDRLAELLVEIGRREPRRSIGDPSGRGAVLLRPLSFEQAVGIAFDRLRHYGAADPTVVCRLVGALGAVARRVPPERRPPLVRQVLLALEEAEAVVATVADLDRVRRAAADALAHAHATHARLRRRAS